MPTVDRPKSLGLLGTVKEVAGLMIQCGQLSACSREQEQLLRGIILYDEADDASIHTGIRAIYDSARKLLMLASVRLPGTKG